jgi:hypothetical protein
MCQWLGDAYADFDEAHSRLTGPQMKALLMLMLFMKLTK